jgi:hypothetical protein
MARLRLMQIDQSLTRTFLEVHKTHDPISMRSRAQRRAGGYPGAKPDPSLISKDCFKSHTVLQKNDPKVSSGRPHRLNPQMPMRAGQKIGSKSSKLSLFKTPCISTKSCGSLLPEPFNNPGIVIAICQIVIEC